MPFRGLQPADGPFYLAPDASISIGVWFGDPGEDRGALWIMAHPLRGEPPTSLVLSNFSKDLDYTIAGARSDGTFIYPPESAYYRYGVIVRNAGFNGVRFNVEGGGNT